MAQARCQRLDQRDESGIEKHDPTAAVIDDLFDLWREETGVHSVQHRTDARHAEVKLEMTVVIHGEGGDAIPRPHAGRV